MTLSAERIGPLVWLGVALAAATLLGYFLASDAYFAFITTLAVLLLALLPYHSQIAVVLSISTFGAAFIVPFFPGRPYLWEMSALLGWSGMVVTVAMRRFKSDSGAIIRENGWLFFGLIGYCAVLVATMMYRGVGFRIFGGDTMGGRFYFQQLVCAIFPFLIISIRPDEKLLTRLIILQFLLSSTFLVSDFAMSYAPQQLYPLFQFFEVTGDSSFHARKAMVSEMRRFQSLMLTGQGLLLLFLVFYKIRDFLSEKGVYLLPLVTVVLSFSLLGGYRILLIFMFIIVLVTAYAQRIYTVRNVLLMGGGLIMGLAGLYLVADQLPIAAQRAVSFLPGISIQQVALDDGSGTIATRTMMREIGLKMIPDYFWVGRGFSIAATEDYSVLYDPTGVTAHANQGRFYNGFIGLMVNTGVFGTLFMAVILFAGSRIAWRVIKAVRFLGVEDTFLRICSIMGGFWVSSVVIFLFLHGDSEYAMKTFSLLLGVLIVCDYHLKQRMLKSSQHENPPSNGRP